VTRWSPIEAGHVDFDDVGATPRRSRRAERGFTGRPELPDDKIDGLIADSGQLLTVGVGGVWSSVAGADGDLARGVALIDWGDRPPTAATSHSPASPTVRDIAPKG
jgi:hypothetical protein